MVDKMGEFARSYWLPIAGALLLAAAWGTSTAQIAAIGTSQDKMTVKLDGITASVASLQTSTQYTNQDIAELRSRMRLLEARH